MVNDRGCGILMHITSLPSEFGIGDMGPDAYNFVDFLHNAKIKFWQILPLNPININSGNSPYSSDSAFAGNTLLISPRMLLNEGLIESSDLYLQYELDFEVVHKRKKILFKKAFDNFKNDTTLKTEYYIFEKEQNFWLDDYAIYKTLKTLFNNDPWNKWSVDYKNRNETAIKNIKQTNKEDIEEIKFSQFLFYLQWFKLKKYCKDKKITIIGDIPYYVAYDSVDVWTNPEYFKLNADKEPQFISGVPPDYFSETGQLWGNPVFNWNTLQKDHFKWWIKRIKHNLTLVNMLRLDHFRAFSAYWEVDAAAETAINGRWVNVPGEEFLTVLQKELIDLPIIAEDLGDIDQPVRDLIKMFGLSGMKVLQFGFDHKINNSPDTPHNHNKNDVIYTGTHDNPTTKAWFKTISTEDIIKIQRYTGIEINENNISPTLIRMALMSVAHICIIPMQDILNLGSEATMNKPGTAEGNWRWQMNKDQITVETQQNLSAMVELYERN